MAKYKKRSDGRYQASVSMGYGDNGKLIRKVVYARTLSELDAKVTQLKYDISQGKIVKSPDTLLEDYAKEWLKTYKSSKRTNTIAMYNNIINKHIIPALGHLRIKEITRSDIQLAIVDRNEHYRTCEQFRMTLKQILDSAVDDKLITSNPCTRIELPNKPRSEKRALTDREKSAIKKADFGPREKAFVYLIYYFGLRREEALAIMPNDFDFKKNTLKVDKAVIFDGNNGKIEMTKNETSDRTLPIPAESIGFFKEYLSKLNTVYLVTKLNGELMTQSSYTKMWKSIVKKMNTAEATDKEIKMRIKPIQGLTAHIFRHNYATMLYYSNISLKKAAQLMGHSNTKMIMEVYSHLDDKKENLVDKINESIAL